VPARIPTTAANGAFRQDSFKYSPIEHARSLFVGFLQGLFSAADPGNYHWEPEDSQSTSEIYIASENPIKDTTVGTRPAISITRGPIQFYSLGLDDMLDFNTKTGTKTKTVLVPGTMIINCCSRVPIETEFLAWICAEQLWLHRELLLAEGFFEVGRMPAFGAPSPAGSLVSADSGDEWYVTAVTCPFQFYRTSRVTPLNQKIANNIKVRLHAQLQQMKMFSGPASYAGAGLPVQVAATRPPPYAPLASDVYGNTPNPGQPPPLLPLVPHPHNPAQLVTYRAFRPNSPGVRPPAIGGQTIPIQGPGVEQSPQSLTATFKV